MATNQTQSWQPGRNDHLIFDWVKMQGKTQGEVASLLNISQPTVSRVIQRYERWLAHLQGREDGRLDPQERLRAQRQLTYDRNELILGSCLRIAQDMEGSLDGTRTTLAGPSIAHNRDDVVRTTHFTVDRTGSVCRFLRLAHRINMEQDKLAARMANEDEAPAEPLTDEELAEQSRQAALDAAEMSHSGALRPLDVPTDPVGWDKAAGTAAERWSSADGPPADESDLVTSVLPGDALPRGSSLGDPPTTSNTPPRPTDPSATWNLEPEAETSASALNNLNSLNNGPTASPTAQPCTCAVHLGSQDFSHAGITEDGPDDDPPDGSTTGDATAVPDDPLVAA